MVSSEIVTVSTELGKHAFSTPPRSPSTDVTLGSSFADRASVKGAKVNRVTLIYDSDTGAQMSMANPVQRFFSCIAEGDVIAALEHVNEDAVFEAQGPTDVPIYGRFEGRDGAKRFLAILSAMFETEVFEFRKWAIADDYVFACGYMQHHVRKTGRVFKSERALVCQVKDGGISSVQDD